MLYFGTFIIGFKFQDAQMDRKHLFKLIEGKKKLNEMPVLFDSKPINNLNRI